MKYSLTILFLLNIVAVFAQHKIVVDANGKGSFKSIQEAINSLTDSATKPRKIFVKKGIYNEKIFISKHNIIIEGEDKKETIIQQSIARDEFRCTTNDDWGVATVNLNGNDVTLKNLTISNNYGFEQTKDVYINCNTDTSNQQKRIRKDGHQMALRTFNTTRLIVVNCILKAFGGDTVSPWNVENGMFYFKDCDIEGGVDFYCPRGWAYAENCRFYNHIGSAAIWHDGSKNEDAKTVLVNCYFDGYEGFKLGRWHRDAQFYLINCRFSKNMANEPIYLVKTNNSILWGNRQYYYDCSKENGDFHWFANNLEQAKGNPKAKKITPSWVFNNQWKIKF